MNIKHINHNGVEIAVVEADNIVIADVRFGTKPSATALPFPKQP